MHPYHKVCGLLESPEGITRALLFLYDRQVDIEKSSRESILLNERGFSAFDAQYGSYCAQWCRQTGRALSGVHLAKWSKRILKYGVQLSECPAFVDAV